MGTESAQRVAYVDCAPFTGGAQQSLLMLVRGVTERGWTAGVLGADLTPGGLVEQCRRQGWPTRELRTAHWRCSVCGVARFVWDRLTAGRRIARAVREWNPVIVHANGVRAALLLPRSVRRRAAVVVHDRDVRVPAAAVRFLASRVAEVIATSDVVAAKWDTLAPDGALRVIPNGFDLAPLASTIPVNEPALAAARLRVVLVADLVPWKRHAAFLEAVALAAPRLEGLVGVVVGRGRCAGDAAYLHRLQRRATDLGIQRQVRFVTDAPSGLPWLAAADVVVSAAEEEPFGRTVIEALALGRPVVAVDAAGPGEILAGCPAATLTGRAPADLAAGIVGWADPAARAAASRPAKAWAGRYDYGRMADAVCALYWDLAGMPGR